MEARTDHCLVCDFVGNLPWALDPSPAQMSRRGRGAAFEPAPVAFYGLRGLRDAGDLATSRPDPDGEVGRAETPDLRLRTVCHPANSESNSIHLE